MCRPILIGADEHAPLKLFGLLLDGLLEKSWMKGSEMEACTAEYQSLMQEHRHLERTSTKSGPDVGNDPTLCSPQAGFLFGAIREKDVLSLIE